MKLSLLEQRMLQGEHGKPIQKAMQILVALGKIYKADRMVPVSSVQISGVSYDNLGEAGLSFLDQMAAENDKVRVLTTLNPAGMDIENWQALGIPEEFAEKQMQVIDAFTRMGVITTCTCTPYLSGNLPHFGEFLAWAESSAVCFANSVLGARTNREGGPGALAAALTGVTPRYGLHLDENRIPDLQVVVDTHLKGTAEFGALGQALGKQIEAFGKPHIPYLTGIKSASLEELKSFCASIATYGGTAIFHMENITPEATRYTLPEKVVTIGKKEVDLAFQQLNDKVEEIDFVTLGCPHLSISEMQRIAGALEGKKVKKEFWITTSRPVKQIADRMGYSATIEASGAKIAADTCCVVAPIKGRFKTMLTDSAKACYYAYTKNRFKTRYANFDEVIQEALK